MTDLQQVITCPNCNGGGWLWVHKTLRYSECPVCEARGFLVIDAEKTLARSIQPKPKMARSR